MSRRRNMTPRPKRTRNRANRRIRFFCTGAGTHGPYVVGGFTSPDNPGRPDIEQVLQSEADTPDPVDVNGRGPYLQPLTTCARCKEPRTVTLDSDLITAALATTRAGKVLRWDVSTGQVLAS